MKSLMFPPVYVLVFGCIRSRTCIQDFLDYINDANRIFLLKKRHLLFQILLKDSFIKFLISIISHSGLINEELQICCRF